MALKFGPKTTVTNLTVTVAPVLIASIVCGGASTVAVRAYNFLADESLTITAAHSFSGLVDATGYTVVSNNAVSGIDNDEGSFTLLFGGSTNARLIFPAPYIRIYGSASVGPVTGTFDIWPIYDIHHPNIGYGQLF